MRYEAVLKGDKLKKEIEDLANDPIIQKMAKEVGSDKDAKKAFLSNEWWAVSAASKRYADLGGKKAVTIGGPLEAMQSLLKAQ